MLKIAYILYLRSVLRKLNTTDVTFVGNTLCEECYMINEWSEEFTILVVKIQGVT